MHASSITKLQTTKDYFLGGNILIEQPKNGYRAGIEPVLLASAVQAKPGQTVLEVGCGVGTASICLAKRVPGCELVGLEVQPSLAALAKHNAAANGVDHELSIHLASLEAPPPAIKQRSFDHVMLNPPFFDVDTPSSPNLSRALGRTMGGIPLADWLLFALRRLQPRGHITIIHNSTKIDHIAVVCQPHCGNMRLFPLWPKQGVGASLMIIQYRKGVKSPAGMLPGMVLHEEGKKYTAAAEAVLSGMQALNW